MQVTRAILTPMLVDLSLHMHNSCRCTIVALQGRNVQQPLLAAHHHAAATHSDDTSTHGRPQYLAGVEGSGCPAGHEVHASSATRLTRVFPTATRVLPTVA